jgi:hypothetical protein
LYNENLGEDRGLISALTNVGEVNTKPGQHGDDYELWLRTGALGEIWNLTEPLAVYRTSFFPVHYSRPNRRDNYKAFAKRFESALNDVGNIPTPLSFPENAHLSAACKRERDFYVAGPRFLGRFKHEKIKLFFNFNKT